MYLDLLPRSAGFVDEGSEGREERCYSRFKGRASTVITEWTIYIQRRPRAYSI